MVFSSILKWLKDSLFPIFCLSCKKEGDWVCASCRQDIRIEGFFSKDMDALDSHTAIFSYMEDELIARLIKTHKYHFAEDIVAVWQEYISEFMGSSGAEYFDEIAVIVPVPLHRRRFAERGFNQAEQIAECLGVCLGKPVENLLRRTRYTEKQAGLKREARLKNVQSAFAISKSIYEVKNKSVLLVDDVFTTGSTMQECARVLRKNGAEHVVGFSLARA